jgi:hypothetical protein
MRHSRLQMMIGSLLICAAATLLINTVTPAVAGQETHAISGVRLYFGRRSIGIANDFDDLMSLKP